MKGNHKQIVLQPFEETINVVVAKDINSAIKYANKYYKPNPKLEYEEMDNVDGMHYKSPDNHRFIFLRYDASIHTVVHECFHAVMKTARDRGNKFSHKGEEFYAYSLGQLTENVMDFFYGIEEVRKNLK